MIYQYLLVIDIQQKYIGFYKDELLDAANSRIDEAKKLDIPIVYIRNIGVLGNIDGYELASELHVESELIFTKRFPDAFTNKEFAQKLKEMNVDTINVVGVDGRCCVFQTVMRAVSRDIRLNYILMPLVPDRASFMLRNLRK